MIISSIETDPPWRKESVASHRRSRSNPPVNRNRKASALVIRANLIANLGELIKVIGHKEGMFL